MNISVLCSSQTHPVYPCLVRWRDEQRARHQVELVERVADLSGGDLLFLVSCGEVVSAEVRGRYRASLVLHASDLPKGRGWSPLVWQILAGSNDIPVTLLEAADEVDTGAVWHQVHIHFQGHELVDEIHAALFAAELALMDFAVEHADTIRPRPQQGVSSYYRRRTPEDSRLDVHKSLAEQFNLLRVADPHRYPAFFEHLGHRYQVRIVKADHET